jgi:hypothetical protein
MQFEIFFDDVENDVPEFAGHDTHISTTKESRNSCINTYGEPQPLYDG